MKTITDATSITGLKRHRIQEYEKAGIAIRPTEHNKYGYGVYTDEMIARLWQIRFYIEAGRNKEQIKAVFTSPTYSFAEALDQQIELLTKKRAEIDDLICVARLMKEDFLAPQMIHDANLGLGKVAYKESVGFWSAIARSTSPIADEGRELTDAEVERFANCMEELLQLHAEGVPFDGPVVQGSVAALHDAVKSWASESCIMLALFASYISPGSEAAGEIDADYGHGTANFLYNAFLSYVGSGIEKGKDREGADAVKSIIDLAKEKYKPGSRETQQEVQKIVMYYKSLYEGIGVDLESICGMLVNLFSDPSYNQVFDKQVRTKGAGKYIGKALSIYYKNNEALAPEIKEVKQE